MSWEIPPAKILYFINLFTKFQINFKSLQRQVKDSSDMAAYSVIEWENDILRLLFTQLSATCADFSEQSIDNFWFLLSNYIETGSVVPM